MTYAIRVHEYGGPEKLVWEELPRAEPKPGEARIQQDAVGLNYIDTYHRTGLYKIPLPSVIGREGAGVVEAVGTSVTDFKVGDRVAYASAPIGIRAAASRLMCSGKPAHRRQNCGSLTKEYPDIAAEDKGLRCWLGFAASLQSISFLVSC